MRFLPITLAALLALIQYPLWLGKGGWVKVWDLDRQLEVQQQTNARQLERNAALENEVGDLKQGLQAIEERARYELGMVRPDELYVQINGYGVLTPQSGASGQSGSPPMRDAAMSELRTADARDAARRAQAARR